MDLPGGKESSPLQQAANAAGLRFDPDFKLTGENLQSCVAGVNPTKSNTNCGSCSISVLLNTLGFHTKSLPETPDIMKGLKPNGQKTNGYDPVKLLSVFKGAKEESLMGNFLGTKDSCRKIQERLEGYGEGAFGILWTEGLRDRQSNVGHYTAWRIIDGALHILEGQPKSEGIVQSGELFSTLVGRFDPNTTSWARLDNCEINTDLLKYVVQNG